MPNLEPSVRSFAELFFTKLGTALLFTLMLAIVINAGLAQGLRFIAVAFFLMSLWHFGAAFSRRRPFGVLSEWGEAVAFSLMSGCALLFAKFLS